MNLPSYSSIYALRHAALQPLLGEVVLVEEKIDGSQFSFGKIDGQVLMRSKGADVYSGQGGMFSLAITTVEKLALPEGFIFRAEFLQKPKHNVLKYDRVPAGNLIVYDIEEVGKGFLSYEDKRILAGKLGLETVPKLYEGIFTLEHLRSLLGSSATLGGCKIEGVVLKPINYDIYGRDKKVLMGKFVSEEFKEKHQTEWKGAGREKMEVVQMLIAELNTPARWQKAVGHLRDDGRLTGTPQDIGPLMKEVKQDVLKEEVEYVKEKLFQSIWPQIQKAIGAGLPEWYKAKLAEEMFDESTPVG